MTQDPPTAPTPADSELDGPPKQAAPRLRLFIAIAMPREVRAAVAKLQENLKKGLSFTPCRPSWVAPSSIHLTLRFLGSTDPACVEPLEEGLRRIGSRHGPVTLCGRGLGVFPHWRRPRVLWLGVQEKGCRLSPLQNELEQLALAQGFDPMPGPFHPHLTLARLKSLKATAALRGIAADHQRFATPRFTAGEIVLFRSELHPEGVQHHALGRYRLH